MSYVIAPLRRVRTDFPEFRASMSAVEADLNARANQIWAGFVFGGIKPPPNTYGLSNIPPRHMSVPRGFGSWSFLQRFTAPGSWNNIFSYTVPVNQIHGFAGFLFQGPNLFFNALRSQVADTIWPIVEIEEAQMYAPDGFAIIFKTDKGNDYIVQENFSFILKGFQERATSGFNSRVVPIGMLAFKLRDDLIQLSGPST